LLNHTALKARHRSERDAYTESFSTRIHRALSWLNRAEQESDDLDARFIFLWISFNAAYANDFHRPTFNERTKFDHFVGMVVKYDTDHQLDLVLWEEFPNSIRLLLDNQYVFAPFWDALHTDNQDAWRDSFERSKGTANRALGEQNSAVILEIVLDRLYVLRNQLVHGGATWNSGVNRSQVQDGCAIMGRIVPLLLSVMMDNHTKFFGDHPFPVV